MFKRIEVKGILGFSFWCALGLGLVLLGFRVAGAQSVFSLIVDKPSRLLRDARALSIAPDGSIYVADTGHHRILQLSPDGKLLGEIGGLGDDHGQFRWPVDVAAEQGTSIWVSDFGNRRVERFTRRFTWQGTIELPSIRADAAAQPGPVAITALGDLFVFDQNAQSLLKFNPLGMLQAEFGDRKGMGWISGMKNLAAHSDFGVVWVDSKGDVVRHMDLFGSALEGIGRGQMTKPTLVAFSEKTIWVYDSLGFGRANIDDLEFRRILETHAIRGEGIQQVTDFACIGDSLLYLLDGRQGQLWKVLLPRE
ncbi:MAG: NHL repeat-containing protein [bacterium]